MENPTVSADCLTQTSETPITTNREFLEAIFGPCNQEASARPLRNLCTNQHNSCYAKCSMDVKIGL